MKQLRKIYFYAFWGYWILFSGARLLYRFMNERDLQITEMIVSGFIASLIFVGASAAGQYISIKPNLKYQESDDPFEPKFGNRKKIKIEHRDFSFDKLKNRIAKKWIITHEDIENKIIKFRTNFGFFSWGVGCYLEFIPENNTLQLIDFPVGNNAKKTRKLSKAIINEIERITKSLS